VSVLRGATPISIAVDMRGSSPSLCVSGTACDANIDKVASAFDRLIQDSEHCVSLDLGDLESIDPRTLELLADTATSLRQRSRRLHLVRASDAVQEMLDRYLLLDLFCVETECTREFSPSTCGIATTTWAIDVFTLACEIENCREARERVRRVAAGVGFDRTKQDDVILALGEAVANAIKHGKKPGIASSFTVSCIATPERLCVSVSDSGPGFDPEALPSFEEALMLESGRGIHCINAVMDDVSYHFDSGTTVRMIKRGY
jgi:anti-sigma regulatory factor (Ser/Thr protein kinase)/anti-anti-sigma regulatory factor